MSHRRRLSEKRGQLSLEALLAFSALLIALSIIALSGKNNLLSLNSAAETAHERFSLSYLAFCADEAAQSLSKTSFTLQPGAFPVDGGGKLASKKRGSLREFLFHNASMSQKGVIHVQTTGQEPI